MNLSQLANPRILDQPVYQPGKPIEQVAREHGFKPEDVCKLASNENPWGSSPSAIEAGISALKSVYLYPEGSGQALREKLGQYHKLDPAQFVLGNGSNEIIELLGHVFLNPEDEVLVGEHAFVVYKLVALLMGAGVSETEMPQLTHDLDAMKNAISERTKLIFLPSPNNPTGTANSTEEISAFIRALPDHVIFCLDEAYAEYLDEPFDLLPFIKEGWKVVGLRTFSKIHGLAGLRIGYGYGSPEMIGLLQQARQPFNANSVAQASALGALEDGEWVNLCRRRNRAGLEQVSAGCASIGLEVVPSQANFLLVKVGNGRKVFEELQARGIITRPMSESLNEYLRISIGTEEQNERALKTLAQVMKERNADS
jgi:histidinol-phosphate aminotransferase